MRQSATIWSYFVAGPEGRLNGTLLSVPRVRVEHQLTLNRLDFNAVEGVKAALGGLCRPTGTGDKDSIRAIPSDEITMKKKVGFIIKLALVYSNLGVTSLEGSVLVEGSCRILRNFRHALRTGLAR